MKQKLKILTLTSIACALVGCGPILTSNQDSVKERRYDNGQLAIQANYSEDGFLYLEEQYNNNEEKDGTWNTYDKSGKIIESVKYKNDKLLK